MRWLLALASFSVLALASVNPRLLEVKTVYILPMGSSMDQYLADRLTRFGKMQVVADPQAADAILTDRLGEMFEKKLDELYPPKKAEDEDEDEDAPKKGQELDQPKAASFGRGKGTYFLVDRKTRNVLWSIYERPRNGSSEELNKTAERIVNHLKKDLKPEAAPAGN